MNFLKIVTAATILAANAVVGKCVLHVMSLYVYYLDVCALR